MVLPVWILEYAKSDYSSVVCGLQDVLKVFMASTAIKSATVQIMDDANKPMAPVCVNQACTGGSAISVRRSSLNSEIP